MNVLPNSNYAAHLYNTVEQMVLRMNLAPVKGWEAHVGTKTTFNMANHFHVSKLAWPSKTVSRFSLLLAKGGTTQRCSERKRACVWFLDRTISLWDSNRSTLGEELGR